MRTMQAEEFGNAWQYEQAKRKARKEAKQSRQVRRGKHDKWSPKDDDNE